MSDSENQLKNIELLIRSNYPIIYIVSPEEQRVMEALEQISRRLGAEIFQWSCLSGLIPFVSAPLGLLGCYSQLAGAFEPTIALKEAMDIVAENRTLFVFKDFHHYLNDSAPTVVRLLREAAHAFPSTRKTIILTGPSLSLPYDLEKEIAIVDFPLPGPKELGALLGSIRNKLSSNQNFTIDLSGIAQNELIKASQGLTLTEVKNVCTRSLLTGGRLGIEQVQDILDEKRKIVRKSGFLEFYEAKLNMDNIGGLENLKRWLIQRKEAFSAKAVSFGLPSPRGILLLGVQGCGKSVSAKAISSFWQLPLLRLDMGRIFDSKIGGSEQNIQRAISMAERISPCILWIDEIDKAFGGQNDASSDGGAAKRVLASFLTWLGEKDAPVFVAATANNISALPSELLRKGRFDEIFFVDVPNEFERQNILSIHLRLRGRDPANFNLPALAQAMDGFSGAEVEQAVIAALYIAFYDNARELSDWDISLAASETVPLSKTMREDISALRQWCSTRARPASESRLMQVNRQIQSDVQKKVTLPQTSSEVDQ